MCAQPIAEVQTTLSEYYYNDKERQIHICSLCLLNIL